MWFVCIIRGVKTSGCIEGELFCLLDSAYRTSSADFQTLWIKSLFRMNFLEPHHIYDTRKLGPYTKSKRNQCFFFRTKCLLFPHTHQSDTVPIVRSCIVRMHIVVLCNNDVPSSNFSLKYSEFLCFNLSGSRKSLLDAHSRWLCELCNYLSTFSAITIFHVVFYCKSKISQQWTAWLRKRHDWKAHIKACVQTWYYRDRVSSCNIYAVQQDPQSVLMSEFIHHVC